MRSNDPHRGTNETCILNTLSKISHLILRHQSTIRSMSNVKHCIRIPHNTPRIRHTSTNIHQSMPLTLPIPQLIQAINNSEPETNISTPNRNPTMDQLQMDNSNLHLHQIKNPTNKNTNSFVKLKICVDHNHN